MRLSRFGSQCAANNGKIWRQDITIGGSLVASQQYRHDQLNRLYAAEERACSTGACSATGFTPLCSDNAAVWTQQLNYDAAGNRTEACNTNLGAFTWEAGSISSTTNQILDAGWGYDSTGNVAAVPSNGSTLYTIAYDAENRQVAFCTNMPSDSGACPDQGGAGRTLYVYDGLGNRVERLDPAGTQAVFVYDAFGNLAAEYSTASQSTSGTQYVMGDHLESTRLLMPGTAAQVASGQGIERHDYLPFGLEFDSGQWRQSVNGYGTNTIQQKFTGQERDSESMLDFFQARYYSAAQGRFTSPDPGNAGADLNDPQTWNGYAYVGNNPLTFTDPSGLGFWSDLGNFIANIVSSIFGGGGGGGFGNVGGVNSGPWSEQLPISGGFGGLNTGGVFGSGNTGPFVFSFADQQGQDVAIDNPYFYAVAQGVNKASPVADPRFIAAWYGYSAAAAVGGTGVLRTAQAVRTLPTMQVAIGAGRRYGIHFAYGVGGKWLQAEGDELGKMVITAGQNAEFYARFFASRILSLPIRNPEAVTRTVGATTHNCFFGVCSAFFKGWGF